LLISTNQQWSMSMLSNCHENMNLQIDSQNMIYMHNPVRVSSDALILVVGNELHI